MTKLIAVMWDFDGTLVTSLRKNFFITQEIMAYIRPEFTVSGLPESLQDFNQYKIVASKASNWRDLYINYFGLTPEETTKAGDLWTKFQKSNNTPVDMFDGLPDLIREFPGIPQGICSQNGADFIYDKLSEHNLDVCFHKKNIIGYDNVPYDAQKPHPHAFMLCWDQLNINANEGTIYYIGDHEQDVQFSVNAQIEFKKRGLPGINVVTIAANYEHKSDISHWKIQPDYQARQVSDLLKIMCQ